MVDSWGKFSDGLLAGNTMQMGLLDECLLISVDSQDPDAHFRGQYCAVSIGMKPKSRQALEEGYDEEEEEEEEGVEVMIPELHIANMKGVLKMALPYNIMATCIPSTCTKEEYRTSLVDQLNNSGLTLSTLECQTKDLPTLRYNAADIIMIITLVVLGILVLVGTVADVWIQNSENREAAQGPLRYFIVFSFYTNLSKIFRINVKENEEVISCLHGIRALSMCWVVFAHSFLLSITASANKSLVTQMVAEHPYFYQIILNGYPSVDTFFVMSGLLVSYNVMKEYQRTSRFNAPLYYIHRFIRLAPPIMLLCGFFAVFPPLFVQGSVSPIMTTKGNMVDNCIKYWWRDSFFLSNVFIGQKDGQTCLPVCWYTAVDFQLYIITPLMLLPIVCFRRPRAIVFVSWLLISVIVPMSIIAGYQLPPTNVMDTTLQALGDSMKYVYTKPWCRASPYLAGIGLGYFLRVVDKEKVQLKWWQAVLGWIAALATMSAVVFGLKDYNTLTMKPHEYVPAISILYGGLHRLAWGVAVAWMIYACHMGYGGPINSLLGHPIWQPLSRLTYPIFLIALNVQTIYYSYYSRLPIYFTPFYKLMETAGILLISSFGGVLLSLLAESPVLGLEKLLLRKPTTSTTTTTTIIKFT
ncbi:nose resistant to fluoxetine protein 6-like isoform X2 [Portunus trituberculatus]|nr:nose resistant to fluoxetine protein 6-like isoform X2 [Portunus trituberculatus]